MRHTYVRFVAETIDEDSGKRVGVFQAAAELAESGELPDYAFDELERLRKWFHDHLDAPNRFARSQRSNAAPKAISWFKSTATEYVSRMHEVCHILNEHGVPTVMLTSSRPGYVVFEDEHQVAAVPFAETKT